MLQHALCDVFNNYYIEFVSMWQLRLKKKISDCKFVAHIYAE